MLEAEITKIADLTLWLREINIGDPVAWPTWPAEEGRLVVCLEPVADSTELRVKLPSSRDDMVKYMGPDRLWFCGIPQELFNQHADIKR